jgi:hypothetical protein
MARLGEKKHAYRILAGKPLSKQTTKCQGYINIDLLAICSENGR